MKTEKFSERMRGQGGDHESKAEGKEPFFSEDDEMQDTSEDQTKLNGTEALEIQDPRQQSITIFPRSSPAEVRSNVPVVIDLKMLQSRFHMRRTEVAKSLKISVTAFKQACRKLGVNQWPRRQLLVDTGSAKVCCADSDVDGRQALKRERGGGFNSFAGGKTEDEAMPCVFQRLQGHPAHQIVGAQREEGDLESRGLAPRAHLRWLLSDKTHTSSNIPSSASSRVSFEEELTKVAAFPSLRDILGTTASPEHAWAMTSRPAHEGIQGEQKGKLDPHAPLRRPSTDESALLQNIQVYLSYPPLHDLLQTCLDK